MLEVKNLSKKYKNNDHYTLNHVNFTIDEGEIVGLIGKNGTGKTTLMKLIAKAIRPTTGDILLGQKSILHQSDQLSQTAFLIYPVFVEQLTALENMRQYQAIQQLTADDVEIEELMTLLDIWRVKDKNVKTFSLGMKQRLSVAMTLLGNPKLLLLDEPFIGLDPVGVQQMITFLKERAKKNHVTLLVSSHQLGELEGLCDRYLYIHHGEVTSEYMAEHDQLHLLLNTPQTVQFSEVKQIDEQHYCISTTSPQLNQVLAYFATNHQIKQVYITTSKDEMSKLFKEES